MVQKLLLFPHKFKKVGWWIFLIVLVLAITISTDTLSDWLKNTWISQKKVGSGMFASDLLEVLYNDLKIIGSIVGALFITCSREQIEDEMIGTIRLNSLLLSLYCYVILVVLATIFINGINFLTVMMYSMVSLPILFLFIYEIMLWLFKRSMKDEKQD